MMLILACDENDNIIHIKDAEKGQTYKCPECNGEVFGKKGEINAHHFCHKSSDCGSNGESVVHRYYKEYIANLKEVDYNGQVMQVTYSCTEKQLTQGLIADVVLILDNWKSIAVEICYKHAKDEEHIDKYRALNMECYEIYVDMNEEQTNFEIVDWDCLWGYDCYELETWKLEQEIKIRDENIHNLEQVICSLQERIESNKKDYEQELNELARDVYELEQEKKKNQNYAVERISKDMEKTIKQVTGFTYRELQSVYYNTKSGNKYYLLDMMLILNDSINDKVKMIQFNWVRVRKNLSDERIFTITFLDWKKNHVAESIYNIKCSTYDFNLLARLITEIYGVKVYKNENGKY